MNTMRNFIIPAIGFALLVSPAGRLPDSPPISRTAVRLQRGCIQAVQRLARKHG